MIEEGRLEKERTWTVVAAFLPSSAVCVSGQLRSVRLHFGFLEGVAQFCFVLAD